MFWLSHDIRAPIPPGNEGICSTTSNTLFSSTCCLGGSGAAISSFALSTSPPTSSLPSTVKAPTALLLFSTSSSLISSSSFTSLSFLMTGAVNFTEDLTFSTTFSGSTLICSFFSTLASFFFCSRAESSTAWVFSTWRLASTMC